MVSAGLLLGLNIDLKANDLFGILSLKSSLAQNLSPKDLSSMFKNKDFVFINVHTPYEGEIGRTDLFINYDEIPNREVMS